MKRVLSFMLALGMVFLTAANVPEEEKTIEEIMAQMTADEIVSISGVGNPQDALAEVYPYGMDNTTEFSELPFSSYPLSVLQDYFEQNLTRYEEFAFCGKESYDCFIKRSFSEINKCFPVQFVRQAKNPYHCYTIYQVDEGGYYYVFFKEEHYNFREKDTQYAHLYAYQTMYLHDDLPQLSDFFVKDIRTLADVEEKADLNGEFRCGLHQVEDGKAILRIYSFHDLGNGAKISVAYRPKEIEVEPDENGYFGYQTEKTHSKEDFVIDHISFLSDGALAELPKKDIAADILDDLTTLQELRVGTKLSDLKYIENDVYLKKVSSKESDFGTVLFAAEYNDRDEGSSYQFIYAADPLKNHAVTDVLIIKNNTEVIHSEGHLPVIDPNALTHVIGKNTQTVLTDIGEENVFYKQKMTSSIDGGEVTSYFFYAKSGCVYEMVEKNGSIVRLYEYSLV